jgi:hypothetical protein
VKPIFGALLAVFVAAAPVAAKQRITSRSYLTLSGGFGRFTGDVRSDVVQSRNTGTVQIGIGYQIADPWLVELSYGWLGRFEQDPPINALDFATESRLTESEKAYRVTLNDLMLRTRWAPSGHRTEYFKPEASLGVGAYQVSRQLRNYPGIPPEDTSQLLAAVELGAAALFVFSSNFTGIVGGRFTIMEREAIVDSVDYFDGFALTLGFRAFLPSPADAGGR